METESPKFEQEREQIMRRAFSSVAHELKTPLACIIGSLGTLDQMNDKLSFEQRDALIKMALSEAERLNSLCTTMLDKARQE